MNKKLLLLAILVIGIIPFVVEAADYAYCTYKTIDCNKIQVGTGSTAKIYNCDQGECIGIIAKGGYETITCIEPAPSKNPYADVYINSYSPLCEKTTCANGKKDGETYCNGNQVVKCEIDKVACQEKSPPPLINTCSGQTTCQQVTVSNADCVCSSNQCVYNVPECVGTTAFKQCLKDANGCTYLGTTTNCPVGKECKNGVCQCNNQCTGTTQKECLSDSTYRVCELNSYGCYVWSSTKNCQAGESCSNGACACPTGSCPDGTKKCYGDTQWMECGKWGAACPTWSQARNCPTAYGSTLQSCEYGTCKCPDIDGAKVGDQKCFGQTQYNVFQTKSGDNCPTWSAPMNCVSGQICSSGVCGCPTSQNNKGDTRCSGTNSYQLYDVKPGEKCPSWSDPINCPTAYGTELQTCFNGACKCPDTTYQPGTSRRCIGTGYQIFDYYGNNCPEWGATIPCASGEQCNSGVCGCPFSSFNLGDRKCSGTFTYKIFDREGNAVCPSWSINDYECPGDEMCVEEAPGKAKCVEAYQDVFIFANDAYAINEPITGIKVQVSKTVGSNMNIPVVARLLESGVEISGTRVSTVTLQDGSAEINFNYAHPRPGALTIEVTVGSGYQQYVLSKDIVIQGALKLKLDCPFEGYVNRDITCTWKVEDSYSNVLIEANPQILIKQGDTPIYSYTPIGKTGVKFQSNKVGSAEVTVTVSKEGYISDSATLTIKINDLTRQVNFEIDDKDFFSYALTGITVGTHKLELIVEESGVPIDVQSIEANIKTPAGQLVPVYFSKVSSGNYKNDNFNFEQAGHTYSLSGTITFTEINKPSLPFEYKITTIASSVDDKNLTTYGIIGGAVAFVVFVIILVALLRKKKGGL